MTGAETAVTEFWSLVGRVLWLDSSVFQLIQQIPLALIVGLVIVLIGALVQAITQGIVLFINRVSLLRSGLTLAIATLIYFFDFIFWFVSTWWISTRTLGEPLALVEVFRTLSWSYAPMMLGILVFIPYFGMPIFFILSTWTFMAMVIGMATITPLTYWLAFQCCFLGWLVLQVVQRTVGYPLRRLEINLARLAAGGDLALSQDDLFGKLYRGLEIPDMQTSRKNRPGSGRS